MENKGKKPGIKSPGSKTPAKKLAKTAAKKVVAKKTAAKKAAAKKTAAKKTAAKKAVARGFDPASVAGRPSPILVRKAIDLYAKFGRKKGTEDPGYSFIERLDKTSDPSAVILEIRELRSRERSRDTAGAKDLCGSDDPGYSFSGE